MQLQKNKIRSLIQKCLIQENLQEIQIFFVQCYSNVILYNIQKKLFKDPAKIMKTNELSNRILFYSPTVQAGWERQPHRTDFQFIKKLGQGSFGTVHQAKHKKSKKIYAIKEIKKATINKSKLIEHAKAEIKIMYSLNHPHIVKLYNHFEDEVSIYLVLEFAGKGQLLELLKKTPGGKLSEEVAAEYIRQITSGISETHRNKIMHRDIKLENILVSDQMEMKVADFGWSHFQSFEERYTFCGTLDYLAPEMVSKGHKHDYRVDLWSLGVLIYQLCTGQSPFSCQLIKQKQLTQQNVFKNITNVTYSFPNYFSQSCRDLIRKLLVYEPTKRLEATEILQHPWIIMFSKGQNLSKKWKQQLQKEIKSIFPQQQINKSKQQYFSKEQIYNYSRTDSIINLKPNKYKNSPKQVGNTPNLTKNQSQQQEIESPEKNGKMTKKLSQLELKVTKLEMMYQKSQDEVGKLRRQNQKLKASENNQQTIRQLMKEIQKKNKELSQMNSKLTESESKLLYYQRNHN